MRRTTNDNVRGLANSLTILALILSLVAVIIVLSPSGDESVAEPKFEPVDWSHPDRPTVDDAYAAVRFVGEVDARTKWYFGVHMAEVQRQAEAAPRVSAPRYHPGATVGECTGFAIPDYIIARESGGNPSAYNPSGAYGCAQTLLSHYSRGSCSGLDPYSIDGQRQCVDILSAGGTNLAPWAATR